MLNHSESASASDSFVSVLAHAEELIDAGDKRKARYLLTQFVERKTIDASILPALAALYLRIGKPDQAVRTITRAIENDEDNADLHNTLGLIFALLGREEESRVEFESAIRLEPDNPEALRNLAFVFHRAGDRMRAYATIVRCAHATPLSVELRLIAGTLLEMDGRLDEAASCYQEVVDLSGVNEQLQLAHQRLVSIGDHGMRMAFEEVVAQLAREVEAAGLAIERITDAPDCRTIDPDVEPQSADAHDVH